MKYAVLGNPIQHSLSPQIHQLFAQQQGNTLIYEKILVEGDLPSALQEFVQQGGVGANITVPFKIEAYHLMSDLTPRAIEAQSVNTVCWLPEQKWLGDNTDGFGLVWAIEQEQSVSLLGKRVLLLGAGGAARGVIGALLARQPASVVVVNRTVDKAKQLAEQFDIGWCGYESLSNQSFDIVINATSGSLQGSLPDVPSAILARASLVYDMVYGAHSTEFLTHAQHCGCGMIADGLGMLVAQAAAAYELWHGYLPSITDTLAKMRQFIASSDGS